MPPLLGRRRTADWGVASPTAMIPADGVGFDERLADIVAEATEVELAGPFVGAHRLQRLGRFAPLILLSMPLVASDPDIAVPARVVIVVATLVCLAAAVGAPWQRLPRDAQGYLVLVLVALIVVLMVQDKVLSSPYSWLELLPMVWLVLYERIRMLVFGLILMGAAFGVAFALHPSLNQLPGLLPPILVCLMFPGLHAFARDARRAMLTQAERAHRDPLTGLLNRRGLSHIAESSGPPPDLEAAAIYVDVDHFKDLNDRLGHAAGDDLLKQVGARLAASVRPADLVARVGGDEFVVIAHGDPVTIKRIRDRIDSLANVEPYQIGDTWISMTLSVGVSTAMRPYDLATLVHDADRAMFEAKDARHGRAGRTPVST
jgi:diguanylate cyclase (GGDEF)-like protein